MKTGYLSCTKSCCWTLLIVLQELFGAIGAVRKVKMVKQGTAEVTYVKKDNALEATKTYNERELDGKIQYHT